MSANSDWKLLTGVIPAFLELAAFWTGHDDDAITARARIGDRDSFHADLYTALLSVDRDVKQWDPALELPAHQVTALVTLMENRCCLIKVPRKTKSGSVERPQIQLQTQSTRRPNLDGRENLMKIKHQIDEAKAGGVDLAVKKLRTVIRLQERNPSVRRQMLHRITECHLHLERRMRAARPLDPTSVSRSGGIDRSGPSSFRRQRKLVGLAHQLLSRHWKCECSPSTPSHTQGKLLLRKLWGRKTSNVPQLGLKIDLDIWFQIACQSGSRWQEADIFAMWDNSSAISDDENTLSEDDNGSDEAEVPDNPDAETYSSNRKFKGRSVKIVLPIEPDLSEDASSPWKLTSGLCKVVLETAESRVARLQLHIKKSQLLKHYDQRARYGPQEQKFISLDEILRQMSPSALGRAQHRYLSALALAYGFMQHPVLDISKPYLTTEWENAKKRGSPKASKKHHPQKIEDKNRFHPYPNILALGILLLQLWLGSPINSFRDANNPNNRPDRTYNIDSDLPAAEKMLEECEGDSLPEYNDAIKACLDAGTFDRGLSLDDEKLQRELYGKVVKLIEKVIDAYRVDPDAESKLASEDRSNWKASRFGESQPLAFTKSVDDCRQESVIESSQNSQKLLRDATCHDAKPSPSSDGWFKLLNEKVHPLLNLQASEEKHARYNEILSRRGPVKIAILDTGIDLPKPPCYEFQDRIAGYKDWIDLNDEIQQDLDGHGTHSTALLMKVAPNAMIYVARVFKHGDHRKGLIPKQDINQIIEKAIRHAVDIWNVDIITMSFGFDETVSNIEKAIYYAKQNDTILLAAASNEGGNADVSWPARMDEVICISASDGLGNKAKFTPNSRRNKDNFIILGEDVMSSWPMHLNKMHEVRKSGTSCATPIAAGIAAIVLELAGSYLHRNCESFTSDALEHFRKLRTVAGMREVFDLMAGERDTYDYIRPWGLLRATKGYKMDSVMDMILQRLRDRT